MGKFGKIAIGAMLCCVGVISAMGALGSSLEKEFVAQAEADMAEQISDTTPITYDPPQPVSVASTISPKAQQLAGCRIALALMNSRDVSLFSASNISMDTVHIKWRSPDDGKTWQARCQKTYDGGLRWAAYNAFGDGKQGRWRDEDAIETRLEGNRIFVTVRQPGFPEKTASLDINEIS